MRKTRFPELRPRIDAGGNQTNPSQQLTVANLHSCLLAHGKGRNVNTRDVSLQLGLPVDGNPKQGLRRHDRSGRSDLGGAVRDHAIGRRLQYSAALFGGTDLTGVMRYRGEPPPFSYPSAHLPPRPIS